MQSFLWKTILRADGQRPILLDCISRRRNTKTGTKRGPSSLFSPGTTIGRLWAEVTLHREAPVVRRERRKEIRFPPRDRDLAIRLPEAIPFGMGPVESWDNPNKQNGVPCSIAPFGGTV
jgi:hypothetical protein